MPHDIHVEASSPPNAFALADLAVGDRCTERWRIDEAASDAFTLASSDTAPLHRDDGHARALGYPGRIVQGMLASLRFSRLLGMFLPGTGSIIMSVSFDYLQPVFAGDTLDFAVAITHLHASGVARLDCTVRRNDDLCVRGRASCLLRTS